MPNILFTFIPYLALNFTIGPKTSFLTDRRKEMFSIKGRTLIKALLLTILYFFYFRESGSAGQIDSPTYYRLQTGMSEGEALVRAGVPDKEIFFDSEAQRTVESIKQLLYIPGPDESDPHLTIITTQKGRVLDIERIKIFSPPRRTIGGQIDIETFNRLQVGMSEGEVLTIAGAPDKEIFMGSESRGTGGTIKQLLYIPGPKENDPHLTVITVKKGRVINMERTKILR